MPASNATGVVLFLDQDSESAAATAAGAAQLLTLVQTLVALERKPRLWIVTRGAQAVAGDYGAMPIGAAAAVGLARIVALEHPELRPVLVDLDPEAPTGEDAALEAELFVDPGENQIAFRGNRRLVARLAPLDSAAMSRPGPVRLTIERYGNLDTLNLAPARRQEPAAGEVEIEVRAAGLNFRDVLNALGMLQAQLAQLGVTSSAGLPFGGECSGLITAVGSGVTGRRVGEPVIAVLATGSMATHVTVDARFVVTKPAALPFADAATLPVAYLTAHYALRQLAGLRAGERVLIHAVAGGVGLAAIRLAQHLGAEVCATASPGKWAALQDLGVTIIGHSRNTAYAAEFAPVDVVLNSLTGDHIPRSLELLTPGGRFIEIGKLGIWPADDVATKRPDVSYHTFDLVEMGRTTPELIQRLLRELATDWASGVLPALAFRTYPLTAAATAFRVMYAGAAHGKAGAPAAPRCAAGSARRRRLCGDGRFGRNWLPGGRVADARWRRDGCSRRPNSTDRGPGGTDGSAADPGRPGHLAPRGSRAAGSSRTTDRDARRGNRDGAGDFSRGRSAR